MKRAILLLAFASLAASDDPSKDDRDRFQGTWEVKLCRVGARSMESPNGAHEMTFEGDQMRLIRNGERFRGGTSFELDPKKSPREVTFKTKGFVQTGIYEFDGNRLRICYNTKKRPTRFDAEERAEQPWNVLYELERK